jgi:hypothetical protein
VTHAAFSHDATALVTVETRPPVDTSSGERCYAINFWDAEVGLGFTGGYAANTSAPDPHLGSVTALACHPTKLEAVSTGVRRVGGEGEFRVWARQPCRLAPGARTGAAAWQWVCRCVGSYKGVRRAFMHLCCFQAASGCPVTCLRLCGSLPTCACTSALSVFHAFLLLLCQQCQHAGRTHQAHTQHCDSRADMPMTAAAYSPDGSVLAVGGRATITLWQPMANALMATLVAPSCPRTSRLTHIAFLPQSPYLVTAHRGKKACLCVWNLLTLTLWWCTYTTVIDVAAHPTQPRFAAVFDALSNSRNSIVAVLGAESSKAEETWGSCGEGIARVFFAQRGSALHSRVQGKGGGARGRGLMFVLTHDRRIMMLPEHEKKGEAGQEALAVSACNGAISSVRMDPAAPSAYSDIFGNKPQPREEGEEMGRPAVHQQSGDDRTMDEGILSVFDAPSHLLPTTAGLCEGVLRLLLRRRQG